MRQNGLGVGAGDATLLAKYFAKGGGSQVRIPLLNEVSPITVEREGGSISRCCCIYVLCSQQLLFGFLKGTSYLSKFKNASKANYKLRFWVNLEDTANDKWHVPLGWLLNPIRGTWSNLSFRWGCRYFGYVEELPRICGSRSRTPSPFSIEKHLPGARCTRPYKFYSVSNTQMLHSADRIYCQRSKRTTTDAAQRPRIGMTPCRNFQEPHASVQSLPSILMQTATLPIAGTGGLQQALRQDLPLRFFRAVADGLIANLREGGGLLPHPSRRRRSPPSDPRRHRDRCSS